jgi:hypothetical protein
MTFAPTLLVFWDYDTQWGGDRSRSPGGPKAWGAAEFENTERLLELHAAYEVPACFAVVGAAALSGGRPYHDPAQIRRIALAGHEVASHGFEHEWLPGVGQQRLRDILRRSKDALEQCIGGPVVSFVPPYNQPFDYAKGWSFSLSERRQAGPDRIDVARLCMALAETGYGICRVSYRPLHLRLADRLLGCRVDRPVRPAQIAGITCVRLNAPVGFRTDTRAVVDRCVTHGGIVVVHGHPHSLRSGNGQDERWLGPFLQHVRALRADGRLRCVLPRELLAAG